MKQGVPGTNGPERRTMEAKSKTNAATAQNLHFENEKILVTGGGGFLGSAVTRTLLEKGASVVVLDDWSTGVKSSLPVHPHLAVLTGSVLDPDAVRGAMKGCTAVVHQAATPITTALRDPGYDCDVNVRGTVNVLLAARDNSKVRRVAYASSDSVYGNPRYLPINEDDLISPLSPFAVSKLAGENYCKAFYETFSLSTTVLRYANVYGPSASGEPGKEGVVGHFIRNSLEGRPLEVHGDGEQTRDFVYITDAVDATLQACCSSKSEGQTYNIGTGIEITVNQLAELVRSVTHTQARVVTVNRLDIDNIRRRVLNIEKIRRELRWTPQFTLEHGLRRMLEGVSG
jgi:UDP-glucose 4-epimerase